MNRRNDRVRAPLSSACCAGHDLYCPIRQFRVIGGIWNPKFNASIKAGHGPSNSTDHLTAAVPTNWTILVRSFICRAPSEQKSLLRKIKNLKETWKGKERGHIQQDMHADSRPPRQPATEGNVNIAPWNQIMRHWAGGLSWTKSYCSTALFTNCTKKIK